MGHDHMGDDTQVMHGWILRKDSNPLTRGRKIVVQTLETFASGGVPAFVETLDAVEVAKKAGMPVAPIMIYGDDVSHVVTERGHFLPL